jgi:NADPH:quinone reductase-like Zn-dependent oxidoreductase
MRNGAEVANDASSFWNALASTVRNAIRPGSSPRVAIVVVSSNGPQLQSVLNLVSEGKIKPVVDRVYPVEEVVAAFQYLESGRVTGKVVIDLTSLPQESTS